MNATAIRDSSLNQRTYWLQGGQYYSRSSNLGEPGAKCALPADKLAQIPEGDRQILIEETSADPVFCKFVAKIMATFPDWDQKLSASARAAAMSVLDQSKGPESKHAWPRLRARVRALAQDVANQARQLASKTTPAERFALVKRIAAGEFRVPKSVKGLDGLGNLGFFDILGPLIGSLAEAGAGLYGSMITNDAREDIAKIQASAAMQTAQAQIAMAQANTAIANAQVQVSNPITSTLQSMTSATVAGIPIIVPVLGAVALGLFLIFGRK